MNITDYAFCDVSLTVLFSLQLKALWSWLPDTVMFCVPQFAYSSDNDGISLATFYGRAEKYETTVVVVKTTKGEVRK